MKRIKKTITAAVSAVIAAASVNIPVSAEVIPNVVISRNCPAYSASSPHTAGAANDDYYYSFWFGTAPDYLAYDLSDVPEEQRQEVIAVWYNTTGQYDYTVVNGGSSSSMPTDYTIEVNAAEGGAYPEEGWVTVETVEGNTLHSRQHKVEMKGYNWIRMNISGADGKSGGTAGINFDIHNISDGVSDSWIFFGDSITAGGMMNCYGTGFAELINQIDSRYFPVQENGGIGGIFSTDGAANIERWLETYPGKYISIAYGTNDAWGNQTGAEKYYDNTAFMVEKVLEAGKIPVVPKIPYATETGVNQYLDDYNKAVDRIYENYPAVVKGPDFDAFFRENPDLLSQDGVHPSSEGYAAMRQLWADTMYAEVYSAEESITSGDVNCDGTVDEADLKLLGDYIVGGQSLGSEKSFKAADMDGDGAADSLDMAILRKYILTR